MAESASPGRAGSELDSLSSAIVEEFERAWLAGRPPAAEYLARHPNRPAILARELAMIDIENRIKRGDPAAAEDYKPLLAEARAPEDQLGTLREVVDRFRGRSDEACLTSDHLPAAAPPALVSGIAADGRLAHYILVRQIGRGGFGAVWEAIDEKLRRRVAIKVLAPELAATAAARQRFIHEARAMAAVSHEHVVRVYAVEDQPTPFLAMEYVDGRTLQARLDAEGPLGTAEVVRIAREIAAALAAAHDIGLIHRDVKPANVILERGPTERVKLTDFGLARATDDTGMTRTGTVVGTPMYMSPEQALGEQFDHRADLFSLGSVMYAMVCGRPPFAAPSTIAVIRRVLDESPEPISILRPDTPRWLTELIARLHCKRPADRVPSARDLERLLARAEADPADPAAPAGASAPAGPASGSDGPPRERSPAVGEPAAQRFTGRAAAAVALVFAAGIAAAAWLGGGRLTPPGPPRVAVTPPARSASAPPPLPSPPGMQRSPGWEPGPPLQGFPGIVTGPTILPGIERWQVIRRVPNFYVASIDWSPRGRIAVAADDGFVRVYDAETMRLERVLGPLGRPMSERSRPSVRWSHDGGLLAAGYVGVRVWNADTGAEVATVPTIYGNIRFAWHPSGRKLAVTTNNAEIRLVTLPGEERGARPSDTVLVSFNAPDMPLATAENIAWSPDGSRLACVGGPAMAADPAPPATLTALLVTEGGGIDRVLRGAADVRRGATRHVAWSPDGGRLALAGFDGGDCFVEVCSMETSAATTILASGTFGPHVSSLAWHPDGRTLFCSFLNETRRLTFDGSPPTTFSTNGLSPDCDRRFVLDPTGTLAATIEHDGCGLKIVRTADGGTAWSGDSVLGMGTARWLADGRLLVVSGGRPAGRVVGPRGDVIAGPWPLSLADLSGPCEAVPHPVDGRIFTVRRDRVTNVFDTDGAMLAGFDGQASRLLPVWLGPENDLGLLTDTGELRLLDGRYRPRATLPMPAAAWTNEWVTRISSGGSDRCRIAYPTAPGGVPGVFTIDPAAGLRPAAAGQSSGGSLPIDLREPEARQVELDRSGVWAAARHDRSWQVMACRLSGGTRELRGHTWTVDDIDWSPSGATLHTAGGDGRSFAWSPESGEMRLFELTNVFFQTVAADPTTGAVALTTSAQDVHCLEPGTLAPRWSLAVLRGDAHASFSPGGRLLGGDIVAVDEHLVYVVDHEDGTRRLLPHREFLAVAEKARRAIRPDAATAGLVPEEVEAGFRRLTRNDWYGHDRLRLGNAWRIGDDGVSAVQMHRDSQPHLFTRERYRDFELRFDVRLESGPRDARTAVCFATPLPDFGSWLALGWAEFSLAGGGSIRAKASGEPLPASAAPPGLLKKNDWNTVRLRVSGGTVSLVLNGQQVGPFALPEGLHGRDCPLSLQFPALSDGSGDSETDPFEPGLARCEFRSIRIRRLDDAGAGPDR